MELVGREEELERVRAWTSSERLVSIVGPAGAGKSRLAREALPALYARGDPPLALPSSVRGGRAPHTPRGASIPTATWISVAAARGAEEVCSAVSAVLGVELGASVPPSVAVGRALARTEGLVVLDGVDGALAGLRELVATWLARGAPAFLVTSRERLGLRNERVLSIGPLNPSAAVELFTKACRALGREPDAALAVEIVERLDRLPQAIEWLASRAALLGEQACLERLRARRLDENALGSALDASLASLDGAAAGVLEALSAFENGGAVEALEQMTPDCVTLVDVLVRRSLARIEPSARDLPRVTVYRTVASRARALSESRGTWPGWVERHAEATLARVERAPEGSSAELAVLAAERAELHAIRERLGETAPELAARASFALASMEGDRTSQLAARETLEQLVPKLAPRLADRAQLALARIHRRFGAFDDARKAADAAVATFPVEATLERAHLDRQTSRLDAALAGYDEALSLARASGDAARTCVALGELGRVMQSLGRVGEARALHVEAIALARSLGLRHREALERSLHARATHRGGEVREAIPLHEHALAMHEELGDPRRAAAERGHLAFCRHELGELDEAERLFRASIAGLADAGDVVLEHVERVLLARLLADSGRYAEARMELALARAVVADLELPRLELTWRFVAGLVALGEGDREAAREEWQRGVALGPLFEVGFETLLGAHLALLERLAADPDRAAEALEAAERAVSAVPAPGVRTAFAVLAAAASDEPEVPVPAAVLAASSDARRAMRVTGRSEPPPGPLLVAVDGRRFRAPGGDEVDLGRKSVPRRLLAALADARRSAPGRALTRDELIAAGWPGERMRAEAADKRLRTGIWTLRRAGLEAILLTRDDGYLLDPLVPVAALP